MSSDEEDDDWAFFDEENIFGDREEDDENEVDTRIPGADHVLVLLDCDPAMFETTFPVDEDDDSEERKMMTPMDASLKVLEEHVRAIVRNTVENKTGKRNGFGLKLFGTRKRPIMLTDEEMEEERNYQKTYNGSNDEVDSDDDGDASDASERSSERNKSRSGDKSHHTIVPMEPPGVSTVKRIRQCFPNVHAGERALDIEQEFGHDERSKLSDYRKDALNEVLSNVLSTFKDAKCYRKPTAKISEKFQEDRKIVWIFTNQDDPCHADENRKEIVRNCAKDLKAQGVELVVWPLCNNNAPIPFMGTKLYNDIAETPDHLLYDKNGLLHLDVLLLGHWKSFRPAFNVPLLLPDYARTAKVKSEDGKDAENETKEDKDANIRLDFYRPIQRKVKPSKVKILRDMTKGNIELVRVTDIRVEDSGDVLGRYKSNANADEKAKERAQPGLKRLRKFFELGGELIPIKNSEIYELKRRSNASDFASLKLIGFKNKSAVPYHYTLDASYFCYPNEDMVIGSTEAFAYLHQSMLKQKVVGIGELLVRKTATSYLVAIYAIQERVASEDADEVGRLISPPGWVVRLLPYEDEMRTLDASNDASFTDEDLVQAALPGVIDKMSDLISHMHLAYKEVGVDFKNQHIEKFWDYVEAIALEEGREADDYRINPLDDKETLADLTRRAKAVSHLLPEDPPKETKKRGNEKISADVDTNWENHLDSLHKFTKKDLVLGLKKYNCPVSGNKNALAERLREAIHSSLNGGG